MSDRIANPGGTSSDVAVFIVSLGLLRTLTPMTAIGVALRTARLARRPGVRRACTGTGRYGVRSSSGAPS